MEWHPTGDGKTLSSCEHRANGWIANPIEEMQAAVREHGRPGCDIEAAAYWWEVAGFTPTEAAQLMKSGAYDPWALQS